MIVVLADSTRCGSISSTRWLILALLPLLPDVGEKVRIGVWEECMQKAHGHIISGLFGFTAFFFFLRR